MVFNSFVKKKNISDDKNLSFFGPLFGHTKTHTFVECIKSPVLRFALGRHKTIHILFLTGTTLKNEHTTSKRVVVFLVGRKATKKPSEKKKDTHNPSFLLFFPPRVLSRFVSRIQV